MSAHILEAKDTLDFLKSLNLEYIYIEIGIGLECIETLNQDNTKKLLQSAIKNNALFIYIGSCGRFLKNSQLNKNSKIDLPMLVSVEEVDFSLPASRSNQADMLIKPKSFKINNLHKTIKNHLITVKCYCSLAITQDQSLVPKDIDTEDRFLVENMEIYFAKAWLNELKSVVVLLPITNDVNQYSRDNWKENCHKAAKQCADFIKLHIKELI